jgi:hypothetical protein
VSRGRIWIAEELDVLPVASHVVLTVTITKLSAPKSGNQEGRVVDRRSWDAMPMRSASVAW